MAETALTQSRFAELLDSLWGIRCVWMRYFDVFRKSLLYYLVTTFTEPFLYLLSFGFGVGGLVGKVHVLGAELSYRRFIFAGIVGQTLLMQGFFEAAFGSFIRMYYQKIFQAMATTPVTLSEVLWGELLWDAFKASLAAEAVLAVGALIGDFPWTALPLGLPVCFFGALLFAGMGLMVAAYSRTIEQINYPQYLLVFPMMLFCGVFFPVEGLPGALQVAAWCLPLTSINSLVRTITLGLPFQPQAVPIAAAWLVAMVMLSRRAMLRRLVK